MFDEQFKLELNDLSLSQAEHEADLRHKREEENHCKINKLCWVLLPAYETDWRWQQDSNKKGWGEGGSASKAVLVGGCFN